MLKKTGIFSPGQAEIRYEYYENGTIKNISVLENGVLTEKTEYNEAGKQIKIEYFNEESLYMTPRLTTIRYDKENKEVFREEFLKKFVINTSKEYLSDNRLKKETIRTVYRSNELNTDETKWKLYTYESDFDLPKEVLISVKRISDKPSQTSQDSTYAGKQVYQYDSKKRVIKKDIYERLGIYSETHYTYNEKDSSRIEDYKIIMFQHQQRVIKTYNSKGKIVEEVEKDYNSGATKFIYKKEYYLNGKLKSTIMEDPVTGKKTVNDNKYNAPPNVKFTNDEKGNWIEMYTDGILTYKRTIVY